MNESRMAHRRGIKASHIARILQTLGCTAEKAALLDDKGRLLAATCAGHPKPSDDTWALVVDMMKDEERAVALEKYRPDAIKQKESDGRWFITFGHPGFNSPANNFGGYGTRAKAQAAIQRYTNAGARRRRAPCPTP